MQECRVSVIVPACNAVPYLERCLQPLLSQTGCAFEVIVVDDASRDRTAEVAGALGAQVLRLAGNAGPSRARNTGARHARGEFLLFIDSDVAVRPGIVARVCEYFDSHPEVAAFFGSYDTEPAEKGLISEYRNLLHHFTHQQGNEEASTFWSGCGAVRRAVFLEAGGFDEHEYPRCIEDIELGYRLRQAGHRIVLLRDLFCTHMKRWTLVSMVKTDIMGRALPWTRLMVKRRNAPNDLNIKQTQKLCVALMGLALLSIPLAWFTPWTLAGGAAALLLIVALNASLFRFLIQARSLWFALRSIPLQWLYFLYSGVSYAYVRLFLAFGLDVKDGNSPPEKSILAKADR